MTLRRLIPYVVVFLILAGAYGGLRWRQEQQVARDEQAKKVFQLKETDLSDLTLVGVRRDCLVKKDQVWRLTALTPRPTRPWVDHADHPAHGWSGTGGET
jgi:hypothetical protein